MGNPWPFKALSCAFSKVRNLKLPVLGLNWVLDVVMNEDQARSRKDHGPENLAGLRRLALNLARLEPSKGSLRGKLKRAGWNDAFLSQLLAQGASAHVR